MILSASSFPRTSLSCRPDSHQHAFPRGIWDNDWYNHHLSHRNHTFAVKKFQRKIEDFVCENCGCGVKGDGYTNHCPKCLWGKHVDVNPGDREEECGGMMKPIRSFFKRGDSVIVH